MFFKKRQWEFHGAEDWERPLFLYNMLSSVFFLRSFFFLAFGFLFCYHGYGVCLGLLLGTCFLCVGVGGWMQHRGFFARFYFVGRVYVMNMSDTMTIRCWYLAVVYVMSVLELAGEGFMVVVGWVYMSSKEGQLRGIGGAPPCASSKGHASPGKDFRHPLLVPARSSPQTQSHTDLQLIAPRT